MASGEIDLAKFTVVLPTYNEVENISKIVEELFRLYPGISISVVDDGSKGPLMRSLLSKRSTTALR